MSDIIHLLPDSVANQIAAGEVIQRPSSIIKELVENALDASATHIRVVVEDAGKGLVQVVDNGCGMSATDARLSFERHATSKIRHATDLFSLRTMGFRGEALASIAAVAQVELRTRQEKDEIGTSIRIEGSRLVSQEAVGCPVGANFAVRNLFFNIPARRKFLKSNQTELSNILSEFERIALAHPETAFTLHSASSLMLDLPAGNFRQRIVAIFGKKIDSRLIPVNTDTTLARINGYVGSPEAARKKNAHQFLFVNGRFMRHPYFAKAIQTAYDRLIPEGLQIPFFVNFEVDPARIDVNIHPTKTEIKFEDDSAIFQILQASVREALGRFGAVPAMDFDVEGKPDIPAFNPYLPPSAVTPPEVHLNASYNPFSPSGDKRLPSACGGMKKAEKTAGWQSMYEGLLPHAAALSGQAEREPAFFDEPAGRRQDAAQYEILPSGESAKWVDMTNLSCFQYHGRFLVCSLDGGMGVIDQHRAHVRVLYEQLMNRLKRRQSPSQRLLFPENVHFSPSEKAMLEKITPQLLQAGFDLSPAGDGSYSISAVPLGAEGIDAASLVNSVLADAIAGEADAAGAVNHMIALSLARKMAMPVGQVLSELEIRSLLEQLFSCEIPDFTPDGHPTLAILDPEKLLP